MIGIDLFEKFEHLSGIFGDFKSTFYAFLNINLGLLEVPPEYTNASTELLYTIIEMIKEFIDFNEVIPIELIDKGGLVH